MPANLISNSHRAGRGWTLASAGRGFTRSLVCMTGIGPTADEGVTGNQTFIRAKADTKRPYQLDRVASSRNNWTSLKSCSRFFSINIICDPAPTTTIRFKGAFDRALKTPNASASVNT
jgi:hypothetical protein